MEEWPLCGFIDAAFIFNNHVADPRIDQYDVIEGWVRDPAFI